MDILIIVLIAVGIFGMALLISKSYSLFLVWKKAHNYGLSPDLKELIALSRFYELEENFLNACLAFKKLDSSISIKDIVRHHMADGDTWAFFDKINTLKKRHLELSMDSAIFYDLSGKDIIEIANQQNEIYELDLKSKTDSGIAYFYNCRFKILPESSAWIEPDLEDYKWKIDQQIKKALDQESSNEEIVRAIIEKYFHSNFWKTLCHGVVLEQNLKITNL